MKRSIVILDDEPLIVAGLTKIIDWNSIGCKVVGTAYNGIDGMTLIDKVNPDIVISDIVMPGKSGLELAEWCFRKHPKTQVILLSAYSDFEYAQKAFQYDVSNYVLKPIDSKKLIGAVKKAIVTIENSEREQKRLSTLENVVKKTKPIVSSSILFDVARYGVNMLNVYTELIKDLPQDVGMVICVKLYNLPKQSGNVITPEMQEEYATEFKANGLKLIRGSADDKMTFLCLLPREAEIETMQISVTETAHKAGERVIEKIIKDKNSICISMVSSPYHGLKELNIRYLQCLEMLPISFFEEKSGTIYIKKMPSTSADKQNPDIDITLRNILHYLTNGNSRLMEEEMSMLCSKLKQYKDKDLAIHALRTLHRQATNIASKAGMIHKPRIESEYIEENFTFTSCRIRYYIIDICNYIEADKDVIRKLKLLIEENYSNYDFGLSAAADKMGLNSSYLSRLFKRETGENFSNYLVYIRIRHAKYLLETTSLSNNEIAAQIGFENGHYFSRVFKKKCGLTPKQYRDRYNIEKGTKLNGN